MWRKLPKPEYALPHHRSHLAALILAATCPFPSDPPTSPHHPACCSRLQQLQQPPAQKPQRLLPTPSPLPITHTCSQLSALPVQKHSQFTPAPSLTDSPAHRPDEATLAGQPCPALLPAGSPRPRRHQSPRCPAAPCAALCPSSSSPAAAAAAAAPACRPRPPCPPPRSRPGGNTAGRLLCDSGYSFERGKSSCHSITCQHLDRCPAPEGCSASPPWFMLDAASALAATLSSLQLKWSLQGKWRATLMARGTSFPAAGA